MVLSLLHDNKSGKYDQLYQRFYPFYPHFLQFYHSKIKILECQKGSFTINSPWRTKRNWSYRYCKWNFTTFTHAWSPQFPQIAHRSRLLIWIEWSADASLYGGRKSKFRQKFGKKRKLLPNKGRYFFEQTWEIIWSKENAQKFLFISSVDV